MENLELFEKAPNETVREYAYRVLYENIMSLKLPPGTAMSEQELSGILHVSRTPVREAFIRLSQKGLLEILPQRGTFVSKIHTEQLAEFRFFRVTLERAIVELACQDFPDPWRTKLEFCIFEQGKFIISKDAEKFSRVIIPCTLYFMKAVGNRISGRLSKNRTWIMPGPASSTSAMPQSRCIFSTNSIKA